MGTSMKMRLLLLAASILIYVSGAAQDITELAFDPMSMKGEQFITLTNTGGTNNLEDYPVRSEYKFSGPEKIYKLPKIEGDFIFYSNARFPDIEVDFFILTDPTDASTAMMWMNGTGTKVRMTANPNMDYYLVVDGFPNKEASVQFSMAQAADIPELCNTGGQFDLSTYLTTPYNTVMWLVKKEGGDFVDLDSGLFMPDEAYEGKYTFLAKLNNADKPNAAEEEFCLVFKACPIPTMSQWALFILALSFSVIALVTFKLRDAEEMA